MRRDRMRDAVDDARQRGAAEGTADAVRATRRRPDVTVTRLPKEADAWRRERFARAIADMTELGDLFGHEGDL